MMHHNDSMDALRYMVLYFNKKEDKEMADNKSIEWTDKRVNDILKAAYELQNLCSTSRGCVGCPFQHANGGCVFIGKPAVPWLWHIKEKTVYTVKISED